MSPNSRRPTPSGAPTVKPVAGEAPTPVARIPARLARSAPLAALWTGFGAAAVGAFIAIAGALLSWIPDAGATGSSGSTVRAGIITFLAAQHGGIRVNGVSMHFVPLGMTAIALWLCWRASHALHALPVVRTAIGDPTRPPSAGEVDPKRTARIVGLQVLGYVITCAGLALFAVVGTSSAPMPGSVAGALVVSAIGFGVGALRFTRLGAQTWNLLSEVVRAAARGALGGLAVLILGGAFLAAIATARQAHRFLDLSRGLSRGLSGLPIATLDLLSAPNAVLASTSYLAGPGFAVGVQSTYRPFGGHPGLVPSFPLLAGLPAGERAPTVVLALIVLTLVGAGTVTGLSVRRHRGLGWRQMFGAVLLAGFFVGLALAGLVAAAGGSLGAHNLSAVGASAWRVGLLATAEVWAVSLPVSALARLVGGRRASAARSIERLSQRLTAEPKHEPKVAPFTGLRSERRPVVHEGAVDEGATDRTAADGTAADGTAADGTATDGTAADGTAVDVAATDVAADAEEVAVGGLETERRAAS